MVKIKVHQEPSTFSNNFYLVLKCCILVKNKTSKFFRNWLMFRSASGLPKFYLGVKLTTNEIWL